MTDPQKLISQATTIHEAATPGPWKFSYGEDCIHEEGCGEDQVVAVLDMYVKADGEFMSAARTLLPQLAEALRVELEGERKPGESLLTEQHATMLLSDREKLRRENRELTRERDEARAEAESLRLQVLNYEKATDLFTRDS